MKRLSIASDQPAFGIVPIPAPDSQLDETIRRLEERKAKLKQLMALRQEVSNMEQEFFLSGSIIKKSARIISEVVCSRYCIAMRLLTSRSREADVADARQIAMAFMRHLTGASFTAIGRVFKRDHGTVIHAVHVVRDRCETEPRYAEQIEQLRKACVDRLREEKLI